MSEQNTLDKIISKLCTKSSLKQDIYTNSTDQFQELKKVAFNLVNEIKEKVDAKDKRLVVDYNEKGKYEFRIKVAGDVLVFHQHTNVFKFDESHPLTKTTYIKEDETRGYCGIVNIYNFLSDSFKYNRINDAGYLVGRIFINKENNFFTEGKRQLSFLYNDFANQTFSTEHMTQMIENLIMQTIDFDLFAPPYEAVKETSVYQIKSIGDSIQIKTGKRLGFQFTNEKE